MIYGLPFWNWMLFFFVYVPIVILWVSVIVDVFARNDMGGWAKLGWTVLVFAFPLFGSLIYLAVRPVWREPLKRPESEEQPYTKRAA